MSDKLKQIIIFPTGQLHPETRKLLKSEGAIAIEVDDPTKVITLLHVSPRLTGDILLNAALDALRGAVSGAERQKFAESLINQLRPQNS